MSNVYIHTPTPAAREAFLKAAQKANIRWCGEIISDASVAYGIRMESYQYAKTEGIGSFRFTQIVENHTRANSPRHFIMAIQASRPSVANA
jgi:hypothetical protein